jgi:hypothetical protein
MLARKDFPDSVFNIVRFTADENVRVSIIRLGTVYLEKTIVCLTDTKCMVMCILATCYSVYVMNLLLLRLSGWTFPAQNSLF